MIENILKEKKVKITKQRVQILSLFDKKNKLTIKEILSYFKDINPSTIYRILILFENKEIINKIVVKNKVFYKINSNSHKHYIECINCHLKQELEECPYSNIDLNGFIININETIKGVCKDCQTKKKFGLFVGSFNPPTKAHYEIVNLILNKKIVDQVIMVPCDNLEKNDLININDRFNMLIEMTKNNKNIIIDDIKVNDTSKNFNYKDVSVLSNKYSSNLFIIIGSDILNKIFKWDNYEYLLKKYIFIVINRFNTDDLKIISSKYAKYKHKFIIFNYDNNISSTKVREMIKNDDELFNALEDNVIKYIRKNKLYK